MILKGNIFYMEDLKTPHAVKGGYLVVRDGIVEKVYTGREFEKSKYSKEVVVDYGDRLIIPGMTDLHLHASQFPFCGLGLDKELLDWLEEYAFPEEMKYEKEAYAKTAYGNFVDALLKTPTTRACIFTTIHTEAALILAGLMKEAGFGAYIGKVNMDRESKASDGLREDTARSLEETKRFIEEVKRLNCDIRPIITPRFVPSCTDELMKGLGKLAEEYRLPVQSHLSENPSEVELVKTLYPQESCYGGVYDKFGLFGKKTPAVMAHCVYSKDAELELMKQNGVFVAHCANSNYSLSSGIAPVRKYLEYGLNVGLGTDIAGGFSLSMFRAIQDTISVSKLYWRLEDRTAKPISFNEAFYLATMGGGKFFGKVGSFLPGYQADIVVLDDLCKPNAPTDDIGKRLERFCYLAEADAVYAKYINGRLVFGNEKGEGNK